MNGIVLWSSQSQRKALVWCSDQGDLAYIISPRDVLHSNTIPVQGTAISFELEQMGNKRICKNVNVHHHGAAPDLADALKKLTRAQAVA